MIRSLRREQIQVLRNLAFGRSVTAHLPTGYGKSLCFWYPALYWKWRVIVVSPLWSLIEEHTTTCLELGLRAINLNSIGTNNLLWRNDLLGDWDICFISPERFVSLQDSKLFLRFFQGDRPVDLLVCDEAHCLEHWQDFRGGYRDIFSALISFSSRKIPLLFLSASFSVPDALSWAAELQIDFERIEIGLGRLNLYLQVLPLHSEQQRWISLLGALRGINKKNKAIVYCSTRQEAEDVDRWLNSLGILSAFYHAGMPQQLKEVREHNFRSGDFFVLCATSAFGMGVNCKNLERVIHFTTPNDLAAYWQEVGRAGRDGAPAYCVALWKRSDITRARFMSDLQRKKYYELWRLWLSGICRRKAIANHLCVELNECGACDCCGRQKNLPDWLWDLKNTIHAAPWWLQSEANPMDWLEEFAKANGESA